MSETERLIAAARRANSAQLRWLETVAIDRLKSGKVIVNATEGVYGLAARARDESACAALGRLKSRGRAKPFIVVAADFGQVAAMVDVTQIDLAAVTATWPGPETWILPAARTAPPWLVSAQGALAVRITGHPQLARLAAAAGALISTSANPPGRPPALNRLAARRYFGNRVACYLPGKLLRPGVPSRIRDSRSGISLRG